MKMAAAAPSPLASSVEKTNGAKLSRLLIDGGTTVLRNAFDSYHPPANLAADLNANYATLDNLLRRRVLRAAQWDQLFPPGGAAPDSNTFDITLLFVLLTNICGLYPPPLGWHNFPLPSDTSLEANLCRIKFFRNELYGHISTTGVDTPTFTSLWQEISAVLVALGLNQAEIDRLKAEHCGEEDYLDALLDWADSEEDIKSQLKGIRQGQTETQQSIAEVRQTQLQELKTLEESQSKLQELHQIQTTTQQTVEEVRQTQLEVHKALQDTKSKLDEVHQTDSNMEGTVERVHQTQLEDRETLQDNKSKLEEVHQTLTKTQETVEAVAKTQDERFEAVEAGLQEIKQTFGMFRKKDTKSRADEVLSNLAKSEFKGDIEYHVGRFQEGTREWVFNKVQNWLDDRNSPNRVMVISANAGMGKSVISAVTCKIMQEDGRLSGSHFCQHNNAHYRNPQLMLQSLACHLCHALPEYKQALVNRLSRNLGKDLNNMGVEELFALLFKEPLSTVADPGRNMLTVIDGLDECEYQERNELLDVICNHFYKLPCWIRFLCTTRPERNIAEALKHLKPFQLESNDEKNAVDIKRFFQKRTEHLIQTENKGAIVEKLVEKSEGLMLYAYFLVSFLDENVATLEQGDLGGSLPLAISSVYHSYFKRLENELRKELGVKEDDFLNLLSAVTASREPLPIGFVSKVLLPCANSPVTRRKVLKAIGSVSSLLPIRDGCVHVIHKSVKDWLTDTSCYGEHVFTVDEKEGHRILASLCADELDELKLKGVRDPVLSSTEKYALHHGAPHMLQLEENMRPGGCSLEQCVQRYVIDLELVYAKLFVSTSLPAEDILWLQRQEISRALSEDCEGLLNTLIYLLRKYHNTFANHPHVFFETVLNMGGTVLSSMASSLLQNKYPEIPYMEFVHKQMQQGAVQARFQCSSKVACFDVSPQLDYMVCECDEGMIQLWSLHTGKLIWERPVLEKKLHFGNGAYRISPSASHVLSFYRSVVFHPTDEVVLPGFLSHAYNFDGDLKPLFPQSSCKFTVCSISGDKTTMLTDCPDDAKCISMWSLKNGSEITRTTRDEYVLSFAWSRDGRLLAISHSTGTISIVDVMDGFRTLTEKNIQESCGMIKFSPGCRSLWCFGGVHLLNHCFCLNINMAEHPNCALDVRKSYGKSFVSWEFESRSEVGFLLGDPISTLNVKFDFVLNKETVLRGSPGDTFIDMLHINELLETDGEATFSRIKEIVFSLSGETVYVVGDAKEPKVRAWDVSSGELVGQLTLNATHLVTENCLVAVKEGVLLITGTGTLEMWNFELSKCVRNWTDVYKVRKIIPISEERVACLAKWGNENKVIILDTTNGKIMSTIPRDAGHWMLVACNSKCQVLTYKRRPTVFELLDGRTTVWKTNLRSLDYLRFGMFSPAERFVVVCVIGKGKPCTVYVLDAVSGEKLHTLWRSEEFWLRPDCKFVSDEECVISLAAVGYCLHLFNVKSGDLLSVIDLENEVNCLAACPRKRLLAIDQRLPQLGFKLIQVSLPQDKDSKKNKRMANTPEIQENRMRKRCLLVYIVMSE
ncbi:uncharacterized protein LOC144640946 isoform X1 [Oculina patagonica]